MSKEIERKFFRYDLPETSNDEGTGLMDRKFALDTLYELRRARDKFPSSQCCLAALFEEVGELSQACLKVAAGKWDAGRIREEALQVAAMAMRIANEGDPSITFYSEPDNAKNQ